jgi:hypothetical protein
MDGRGGRMLARKSGPAAGGVRATTPLGLMKPPNPLPRVGAGRQPRGLGHHPFGIAKPVEYPIHEMPIRCRTGGRTPKWPSA